MWNVNLKLNDPSDSRWHALKTHWPETQRKAHMQRTVVMIISLGEGNFCPLTLNITIMTITVYQSTPTHNIILFIKNMHSFKCSTYLKLVDSDWLAMLFCCCCFFIVYHLGKIFWKWFQTYNSSVLLSLAAMWTSLFSHNYNDNDVMLSLQLSLVCNNL